MIRNPVSALGAQPPFAAGRVSASYPGGLPIFRGFSDSYRRSPVGPVHGRDGGSWDSTARRHGESLIIPGSRKPASMRHIFPVKRGENHTPHGKGGYARFGSTFAVRVHPRAYRYGTGQTRIEKVRNAHEAADRRVLREPQVMSALTPLAARGVIAVSPASRRTS